jgi:hypothetical protein
MKNVLSTIVTVVLVLIGVYFIVPKSGEGLKVGNAVNDNIATSTDSTWDATCAAGGPRQKLLKNGFGTLSSVIILTETAGSIRLVDATSTNHGHYATSTVMDITIPASLAEGAYPLNVVFNRGLLAVCTGSTNIGTSTITWQ